MEKMTINQLPSRTWNRLGVNEASIDWDESATVVLPEESAEKADMLIASDAAYARKRVTVQAEKGAKSRSSRPFARRASCMCRRS